MSDPARWYCATCDTGGIRDISAHQCAAQPAPGGRPRDAREEIAAAIYDAAPGDYLDMADAVLAVPTIADALAAVERVEALAERAERDADEWAHPDAIGVVTAEALHRALDKRR